jgi:hypothetical protein
MNHYYRVKVTCVSCGTAEIVQEFKDVERICLKHATCRDKPAFSLLSPQESHKNYFIEILVPKSVGLN